MAGRGTNSIEVFNRQQIKDMQNALRNLPKEFSVLKKRNILKKGADVFIARAKSKAPVETGELREAIGTKTFRNNKNFVFAGIVTKKSIKSVTGKKVVIDGFYAKFIEYGFRQIAWPEKGDSIKKGIIGGLLASVDKRITTVKPKPFLRPAWDETKNQMRADVIALTAKKEQAYERRIKKQ